LKKKKTIWFGAGNTSVTVCETVKTQLASHSSSGWAFLISTIWHWVKSRHLFYLFIYFFIIII